MDMVQMCHGRPIGRGWKEPLAALIIVLNLLLLSGCSNSIAPVITTGSYKSLPSPGTSVLVAADDDAVRAMLAQWLRDRDLSVVGTDETDAAPSCDHCTTASLLAQAKRLEADQIAVVEISSRQSDKRALSVRGLSAKDGAELWSGTAWSRLPSDASAEELQRERVLLSCHVLATVWRFRAGGIALNRSIDPCYFHP
jgi:hypothetical protein